MIDGLKIYGKADLNEVIASLPPDPDSEAPVRFLPEYDNALLSYADRTRFGADADRRFTGAPEGAFKGSVLVDGRVRAIWAPDRAAPKGRPAVVVTHHPLTAAQEADVEAEGRRMAVFWLGAASEDDAEVRFVPLGAG